MGLVRLVGVLGLALATACAAGGASGGGADAGGGGGRDGGGGGVDAAVSFGDDYTLYGVIADTFVELDPETGALREVGPTEPDARFGWDPAARKLRLIRSPGDAPSLGTMDPCTGVISVGPAIRRDGVHVPRAEALAWRDDAQTMYVGIENATLATLDPELGTATAVGNVDTLQDDIDAMIFAGPTLYALDLDVPDVSELSRIDPGTATATRIADVAPTLRRIAYDPQRALLYSFDVTSRELVTIDPANGRSTPVGPASYAAGAYGTRTMTGFVATPRAICP